MEELINQLKFQNELWIYVTPLIMMLCDIVTGYIQALINKNVVSSKMRVGLLHKILNTLIIFIAKIFSLAFGHDYFVYGVSMYIVVMELISIFENLEKAGIKIDYLKKIFQNKKEEKK